jgi:hypothetical protein
MTNSSLAKRGPKTEKGKLVASMNSTRHGILSPKPVVTAFESEYGWKTHRQAILDSLEPEGGIEQALAERVALNSWRLNRVAVYETEKISELQDDLVDGMRRDAQRYPSLHADEGNALKASEDVDEKRVIHADVLTVLRQTADELVSHHTMSWIYEQAPWYALELKGYQDKGASYDPDEDEDERLDASDVLEEKLRERLEDAVLPPVSKLREALEWLVNEVGLEPDYVDGELVYTPLEGLLEKLATLTEYAVTQAEKRAAEAEKLILSKRRARILPNENELVKLSRYEAHLSREMYKALHELEALQARRAGEAASLARVDVQGLEAG